MTPTPEQLDYALRWMKARGKEPWFNPPSHDYQGAYIWKRDDLPSVFEDDERSRIPAVLIEMMQRTHSSHCEAIDALAIALAECRAACEIPEPPIGG